MPKKKATVVEFKESRSIEQLLLEENKRLKAQLASVMKENAVMRKQLRQPETGPIWPQWIDKHTVRPRENDLEYLYEGLTMDGDQVMMDRTGRWESVSRVIYRRYYGEIPEGHYIYHIDGDRYNKDPNNLVAMSPKDYYENNVAED